MVKHPDFIGLISISNFNECFMVNIYSIDERNSSTFLKSNNSKNTSIMY